MSLNLPQDRLATLDEGGSRIFLHPLEVRGRFHSWRQRVHLALMAVFLLTPFVKINSQQAILIDIINRKFIILGQIFSAHDVPRLFFVLGTFVFALFFFTALLGRVWCGWACPQTVFVDFIYRKIEGWCEGSAHQRRLALREGLTLPRLLRKLLKWMIFAIISTAIALSFISYFIGATAAVAAVNLPQHHPVAALTWLIIAVIFLFNFGWFREQFCVIMCPYGRFQSLLMDSNSLAIAYDQARGEPRRGVATDSTNSQVGDCVNCFRCVQVCPTGIDIRRGTQMECLACTACADACDEIMAKVKKPRGLIRYTSERLLAGQNNRWLRTRTLTYGLLFAVSALGLLAQLFIRNDISIEILRAKDTPYQIVNKGSDKMVINHFRLFIANQSNHTMVIKLHSGKATTGEDLEITAQQRSFTLAPGSKIHPDLFLQSRQALYQNGELKVVLSFVTARAHADYQSSTQIITREVKAIGPY